MEKTAGIIEAFVKGVKELRNPAPDNLLRTPASSGTASHTTASFTVQFMEWLEYRYGCDLVTAVDSSNLSAEGTRSYKITTQKEIFPILDRCHCIPQEKDA